MTGSAPKPPAALGVAGTRLWASILGVYELEEHEAALLLQACLTVDTLDELDALIRRDGLVVASPQGPRAHPALVEARQQRITLARVLAALRLPDGAADESAVRRPQRRGGARGVYRIGGAP